ncbi:50S ribosomal protein L24 [Candidatus Campbellbacteria bacterium CG22_combo_CG10-13_8_21_14_all_36_13]|uniref:Large ribosomal subunit protein uL24 n=1 Tax=Candidatus Campbellbacteria bacterium CG22_combo_CG10-13_8_21_14_all_36_13 TaxID=1974529 RepID=A0A2H0DY92_9BACT|nr:MAG: 50S ribosomal protein L24 [Candidatus Campbellbacteria bacterium CG22_combo_CG10-13_8_21_14_all_36_13]
MKIRKNDTVIIKLGKDRGKTGKVVRVITKDDTLLVEGLNLYKKHQKARSQDQKGGIIEKPMPIKISNVMIFDSKTNKGVRVGYISDEGKKTRVIKVSGKNVKI